MRNLLLCRQLCREVGFGFFRIRVLLVATRDGGGEEPVAAEPPDDVIFKQSVDDVEKLLHTHIYAPLRVLRLLSSPP